MFGFLKKEMSFVSNVKSEYKFTCYSYSTNQILHFKNLINELGLEYESIIAEGVEYLDNFEKELAKFLHLKNSIAISFKDQSSLHVHNHRHNGQKNLISFSFYLKYNKNKIDILLNFIQNSKDIYYAYLANQTDIGWQNETSIDAYKANNRSMKYVRYGKDIFNFKCIDVSGNYGRTIYKDGILYVAAYMSWFGDLRKIYSEFDFSFAYSVKSLDNKLIQVQLYSDILDDCNLHRYIQKKYLEKLNLL
jgi:hypothetical protein